MRLLVEIYKNGKENCGFEIAMNNLMEILQKDFKNDVYKYFRSDFVNIDQLEKYVLCNKIDFVFPIFADGSYNYKEYSEHEDLLKRTIRIWNDISDLCSYKGASSNHCLYCNLLDYKSIQQCHKLKYNIEKANINVTNIFFFESELSKQFINTTIIPWSVSYIENCDLRVLKKNVLILVGKTDNVKILQVIKYFTFNGFSVRILFSQWNSRSSDFRKNEIIPKDKSICIIDEYNISKDYKEIFAEVNFAVILSDYYETYNFLGNELVNCGIPLITYKNSGYLSMLASACISDIDELAFAVQNLSETKVCLPSNISWHMVGEKYMSLFQYLKNK